MAIPTRSSPCPSAFDHLANNSSKLAMAALTSGFIVCRHCDPASMWIMTGALANKITNKLLKDAIQQRRPVTAAAARRVDPGMPSSHAQSLGYLSTYSAIGIAQWSAAAAIDPALWPLSIAPCVILLGCGVYLAKLRISTGFHTPAQVAVGLAIGSCSAAIWSWMWSAIVVKNWPSIALPEIAKIVWIVVFVTTSVIQWRSSD